MNKGSSKRVLLLGWDGADWKIIYQLLDAGQMPALEKFINQGVMGNIATLQPSLSPILWTTIATGKRADRHGILGFVEPNAAGSGVQPVSSQSLACQPLWNIISRHGKKSAVVNWFASHPADIIDGIVVSDFFRQARGKSFDHWPMPPRTVSPVSLEKVMKDLRVHPADIDPSQVLFFIPDAANIDQTKDKKPAILARLLAQCATVHAAGTHIAEHEKWDLLAVYYDTIDRICHHFMGYRAPKMAHISDQDVEMFGSIVDNCYRFFDVMLARYMQIVGEETTIVLVSDHGFHSDHLRPVGAEHSGFKNPVYWHREYGIFAAKGPGIKQDDLVFGSSLLDVGPTVLHLMGLPVARDMPGKVLTRIFEHPRQPEYIDTYETQTRPVSAPSERAFDDPESVQEALRQLADLGYIEPVSQDAAQAIEKVTTSNMSTLAEVHFQAGKFKKAAEMLEQLLRKDTNQNALKLKLAQCHLQMGKIDACRHMVDEILADTPESPQAHFMYGATLFSEEKYDAALDHFNKAEETGPGLPNLHNKMATVYLRQKRWKDAERVFRKALDIDGDSADAYRGLGTALYFQEQYESAVENLLRSIGLMYYQPSAHLQLGYALIKLGHIDDAIEVFQRLLELAPDMAAAHKALSGVYRAKGEVGQSALHTVKAKGIQDKRRKMTKPDKPDTAVQDQAVITVVTGLPRSGTSLMLQMLEAGGMEVLTDHIRKADEDNPKGYYEFEKVKAIKRDVTWLDHVQGRAVKIIYSLLYDLPASKQYNVLFMERHMDEVLASQEKMLKRSGKQTDQRKSEKLKKVFETQTRKLKSWLSNQKSFRIMNVSYNQIIETPVESCTMINKFLEDTLNIEKMAAVVDKSLYRQRR
ncbi:MAG: alkaline phosphatase family protein [Deltaproteobacteria bacterium]|nr:alkaline phosphatase family protein [Deltaproteobacteria bacterium]